MDMKLFKQVILIGHFYPGPVRQGFPAFPAYNVSWEGEVRDLNALFEI